MAPLPSSTLIRSREVLLISTAVTLALYLIPQGRYVAYPLLLLSTLVHELGHGLTALLVGGSFHRLEIWPDGSGAAHWSGRVGAVRQAMVAAGGLVGPAIAAAVGFAAGRSARGAQILWYALAAGLGLALLLVVRNFFGFVFVALLAALAAVIAGKARGNWPQLLLVFFSVQLALSVFSRADYLFTPVAQTARGPLPSDAAQIAKALIGPYWFWGAFCGAVSLAALTYGITVAWRATAGVSPSSESNDSAVRYDAPEEPVASEGWEAMDR